MLASEQWYLGRTNNHYDLSNHMENRLPDRAASSHRPSRIPHAGLERFLGHIESGDGVAPLERVDRR